MMVYKYLILDLMLIEEIWVLTKMCKYLNILNIN